MNPEMEPTEFTENPEKNENEPTRDEIIATCLKIIEEETGEKLESDDITAGFEDDEQVTLGNAITLLIEYGIEDPEASLKNHGLLE